MTSRRSRRSRRKRQVFVPDRVRGGESSREGCWCGNERLHEAFGPPVTPPPDGKVLHLEIATPPFSPEEEATHFIEHCILVASGSTQANDDLVIHRMLELIAEGSWPSLTQGVHAWFDAEAKETIVETADAAFAIRVREVPKATAPDRAVAEHDPHHMPPVPWQH